MSTALPDPPPRVARLPDLPQPLPAGVVRMPDGHLGIENWQSAPGATERLLDSVLTAKPLKPGEGPKVHYLPAITAGKCTARPISPDHVVSDTGAVTCGMCRRTVLYKTAATGDEL